MYLSMGGCVTGSAGKASPHDRSSESADPVLRAKYLDYCSARVAETLLSLSPDEMFLLAEDAVRERADDPGTALNYDEIVQLATGRISRKLSLPPFEDWAVAYREDPSKFDREMLGLWESEMRGERG